jgi:hypothetical protein
LSLWPCAFGSDIALRGMAIPGESLVGLRQSFSSNSQSAAPVKRERNDCGQFTALQNGLEASP